MKNSDAATSRGSMLLQVAFALVVFSVSWQAMAYPFAYVTNGDGKTLVVDVSSRRVVDAIPQGAPVDMIAPDGRTAYSRGSVGVVVTDLQRKAVIATIPVPGTLTSLLLHPYGTRLYAVGTVPGSDGADIWTIHVIDVASRTILSTMTHPSWQHERFDSPGTLQFMSPDGELLYYGAVNTQTGVIETRTGTVHPRGIDFSIQGIYGSFTISPGGNRIYEEFNGDLCIAAPATYPFDGDCKPLLPSGIVKAISTISPDGDSLLVQTETGMPNRHVVAVVDSHSRNRIASASFDAQPSSMSITQDGRWALASFSGRNTLTVLNLSTWTEAATIRDARLRDPGNITLSPLVLRCSRDGRLDGKDRTCMDALVRSPIRSYLWPGDHLRRVDFYLDGRFHRTAHSAPWALDGASVSRLGTGPHEVRTVLHFNDPSRPLTLTTRFHINKRPLRCSGDSVLNDQDPACDGRTHFRPLWFHWWPATGVRSIDFYLDGTLHRTVRSPPWTFDAGATDLPRGTHEIRSIVSFSDGRRTLTENTTVIRK